MKRKIEKYLSSKKKSKYNNLDVIFELYCNGEIKKLLSKYSRVVIYPTLNKKFKTIQLNYNYHNICVTIDFFEEQYSIVLYNAGANAEELDRLFIDYDYQDNFSLEELINEIDIRIKKHPKLKETNSIEKRKIYSTISWLCMCLSIIVCSSIALYCIITGNSVQLNAWWAIFFILVPLITWFIFAVKAKKY